MIEKTLYIRNMVCDRCITTVGENLRKFNIAFKSIQLGEVVLLRPLEQNQKDHLSWQLGIYGFGLLDHKDATLIKKIKRVIEEVIDHKSLLGKKNYIQYIADKLHLDSKHINLIFSLVECMSLKKYIALRNMAQVKELLYNNNFTLGQISDKLGYRNIQHLSSQFREVTGMTPAQYNKVKKIGKQSLNGVD